MAHEDGQNDVLLGFLGFYDTPKRDGYLSAILVTNGQGVPQEFRCTHPVRPTVIQRLLYGTTIESYVGVELCGNPPDKVSTEQALFNRGQ